MHPTVEERAAAGRAGRHVAPRGSHAEWDPDPDRPDPVDLLEKQSAGRVAELVPIRNGRMLTSPFAFFRGAASIMAADLAGTPDSGLRVQVCGDAHLSNFGVFAAPDRRLVFDVNDFDETLPAPWEWDVKRLAASLAVAGRARGVHERKRSALVEDSVRAYRRTMRELAGRSNMEVWYTRIEVEPLLEKLRGRAGAGAGARARRALAKARAKNSARALRKYAVADGGAGELRLASDPPLLVPLRELLPDRDATAVTAALDALFRSYKATLRPDVRRLLDGYRLVDMARKVVGVGSVGTRAWVLLLLGRGSDDPLVLQAKEASASVLEPFVGASPYRNQGRRVVEGQRLTQSASDVMLGWVRTTGTDGIERDFYLRQLWDAKASVDVDQMEPSALGLYGRICGATLARAHARSGDRVAIASYLGSGGRFERALAEFAETYADCNWRDYDAFSAAVAAGRLEATRDV